MIMPSQRPTHPGETPDARQRLPHIREPDGVDEFYVFDGVSTVQDPYQGLEDLVTARETVDTLLNNVLGYRENPFTSSQEKNTAIQDTYTELALAEAATSNAASDLEASERAMALLGHIEIVASQARKLLDMNGFEVRAASGNIEVKPQEVLILVDINRVYSPKEVREFLEGINNLPLNVEDDTKIFVNGMPMPVGRSASDSMPGQELKKWLVRALVYEPNKFDRPVEMNGRVFNYRVETTA